MRTREFGRLGWAVGEVGYGTFGMGGTWGGGDDGLALDALRCAADLGCNFFDTALQYGDGHAERLVGTLLRERRSDGHYIASKVPPRSGRIPADPQARIEDVYPPGHIRECVQRSLRNLGTDRIDLMQFHTWQDGWAGDEQWQQAVRDLTAEGLVRAWGIAANRWEPDNCLDTLRTGLIDAVQVTYNVFEQAPEDKVLPLCAELDVAVIARVPFDEGGLTGTLTRQTEFAEGDWRNSYFPAAALAETVDRAEALRDLLPAGMSLPELALRFILSNPSVSTVIPGMRHRRHVTRNLRAAEKGALPTELLIRLRQHRWDRRRPAGPSAANTTPATAKPPPAG